MDNPSLRGKLPEFSWSPTNAPARRGWTNRIARYAQAAPFTIEQALIDPLTEAWWLPDETA